MNKVKVFSDSTCDLPIEIIEENNISIVPLCVGFENEILKDGVEISTAQLFEKVEEYGELPKTSAPSPIDFRQAFKPYIEEGYDIIYIGLSSLLSCTLQNARIAASEFPENRIEVVDSLNLSTGIGLLVLKAVDLVKEGLGVQEIAAKVKELVPKVETAFVIDTLDYLHKGGRCSSVQSFVGSMLKIRPIVKVVDGKMILGQKARGKKTKALNLMLNEVLDDKDNISLDRMIVIHSFGEEDAEFLKARLKEEVKIEDIIMSTAGCVISSHCGPNTVGVMYMKKLKY